MMSPNLLARATPGFRCGYNDALNERDMRSREDRSGFWVTDYVEGYHARLTEVRLEREAARKACAVPAEVFEPMRNARGEIVEPVFGGSAPYSDESREADRASAGYRKLHGGEGW